MKKVLLICAIVSCLLISACSKIGCANAPACKNSTIVHTTGGIVFVCQRRRY